MPYGFQLTRTQSKTDKRSLFIRFILIFLCARLDCLRRLRPRACRGELAEVSVVSYLILSFYKIFDITSEVMIKKTADLPMEPSKKSTLAEEDEKKEEGWKPDIKADSRFQEEAVGLLNFL